jgi:hypothetical protein
MVTASLGGEVRGGSITGQLRSPLASSVFWRKNFLATPYGDSPANQSLPRTLRHSELDRSKASYPDSYMKLSACFWCVALVAAGDGCAGRATPHSLAVTRPSCAPQAPDTTARRAIYDPAESIFPDPSERTQVRFDALYALIRRYANATGRLPATLREALPQSPDECNSALYDAWGREIQYRVHGSRFELRSAGADGSLITADDIVEERARGTLR